MPLQRSEPPQTGCSPASRLAILTLALAALVGVRPAMAQAPTAPTAEPAPPPPPPRPVAPPAAEERATVEDRLRALQERVKSMEAELARKAAPRAAAPPASADDPNLTIEQRMRARRDRERPREERDPAASRPDANPRQNPYAPPGARTPPRQGPGPVPAHAAGAGGVQLDLVNLANSLVDASGATKQARIALESLERAGKSGAVSQQELAESRARLETSVKRLELLRSISHVAMESARQNHALLKRSYEAGMEGGQAVLEAEGKVKMLELIVRGAD